MKWHKVEFELGASKSYGGERLLDYWSKKEIRELLEEYILKIKEDYYFHIKNIKIKETK